MDPRPTRAGRRPAPRSRPSSGAVPGFARDDVPVALVALLGSYLAFLVAWALASGALAAAYRWLTPASPGPVALAWAALGTGSELASFSLGFVLFLHVGVDVGAAYGGELDLAIGLDGTSGDA